MNLKLKKSIFFVNSSPEAVVHLLQKTLHRSPEFCVNPLKLNLRDEANQMGSSVVRWDL